MIIHTHALGGLNTCCIVLLSLVPSSESHDKHVLDVSLQYMYLSLMVIACRCGNLHIPWQVKRFACVHWKEEERSFQLSKKKRWPKVAIYLLSDHLITLSTHPNCIDTAVQRFHRAQKTNLLFRLKALSSWHQHRQTVFVRPKVLEKMIQLQGCHWPTELKNVA